MSKVKKMLWDTPKWQLILNSTNSPAVQKWRKPSLHSDYKACMIDVPIHWYYTQSSLKFGTT